MLEMICETATLSESVAVGESRRRSSWRICSFPYAALWNPISPNPERVFPNRQIRWVCYKKKDEGIIELIKLSAKTTASVI